MDRIGMIFKIRVELKEKYMDVHTRVWPELQQAIKEVGIKKYTSFYMEDGIIFTYLEADDFEEASEKLKEYDVKIKWENKMDKYFIKEDKSILGPETIILPEVFNLE